MRKNAHIQRTRALIQWPENIEKQLRKWEQESNSPKKEITNNFIMTLLWYWSTVRLWKDEKMQMSAPILIICPLSLRKNMYPREDADLFLQIFPSYFFSLFVPTLFLSRTVITCIFPQIFTYRKNRMSANSPLYVFFDCLTHTVMHFD